MRVIRLLAANTVEESMHRLACDKLRLEEDITGDWVHTADIKVELEEENEDETEGTAGGSRTRRDSSLSKAVEAREEEDLALKGSAAKELTELLREALYAADERGSVEAPQDMKAAKESAAKAAEEKKEEDSKQEKEKEDAENRSEETSSQVKSKADDASEPLSGSLTTLQSEVVDENFKMPSQTQPQSQTGEEVEQCSTKEPLEAKVVEKEEEKKEEEEPAKEDELKKETKEETEVTETADEGASVHSAGDKLSNPSEISEETRPLIISEQRSSTDSEEIDVVGET